MFIIKAFKATDDYERCQKFISGHKYVLDSIGVKQVTSSNDEWPFDQNVYVFLVETTDDNRVLGGGRIHVASKETRLPLEGAIIKMDSKITELIDKFHSEGGTGELCGLWNSREIAGMGFGSIFLVRAGVSIVNQLNIKSLFSLCASYTVSMAENVGFKVEKSIGQEGTFYYPKLDLVATALILHDVNTLENATEEERFSIFNLRKNPKQIILEKYKNKEVEIDYDILIEKKIAYE